MTYVAMRPNAQRARADRRGPAFSRYALLGTQQRSPVTFRAIGVEGTATHTSRPRTVSSVEALWISALLLTPSSSVVNSVFGLVALAVLLCGALLISRPLRRVPGAYVVLGLYFLATTLLNGADAWSLLWVGRLALFLIVGIVCARNIPVPRMMRLGRATLTFVLGLSLALGLAAPEIARIEGDLNGVANHKNTLGLIAALAVAFAVFSERPPRAPVIRTVLESTLFVIVLVEANSATSFILAAAAVVVRLVVGLLRPMSRRRELVIMGVAMTTPVALALWSAGAPGAIAAGLGRDLYFSGRTSIWEAGLWMWRMNPVFGIGFGNSVRFEEFAGTRVPRLVGLGYNLHSGYLRVLVETGIVGLAIFAYCLLGTLRRVVRMGGADARLVGFALVLVTFYVLRATVETSIFGILLLMLGVCEGIVQRVASGAEPGAVVEPCRDRRER